MPRDRQPTAHLSRQDQLDGRRAQNNHPNRDEQGSRERRVAEAGLVKKLQKGWRGRWSQSDGSFVGGVSPATVTQPIGTLLMPPSRPSRCPFPSFPALCQLQPVLQGRCGCHFAERCASPKPLRSHSASSTCNPTAFRIASCARACRDEPRATPPTVDDDGEGEGPRAVASLRRTDLAAEETPEPTQRDPGRPWANRKFVRVPGWTSRYRWLSLLASKTARDEVLLYFRLASKDGTQPKSDASCNARPTQRDST